MEEQTEHRAFRRSFYRIDRCSQESGRSGFNQTIKRTLVMSAPKGNQFWKLRNKHGRSKRFASPEQLWEAACEYFAYCDRTPWKAIKNKTKGEIKEKEESPTQRPYSLTGLMAYLDVSKSFWNDFKKGSHEDFSVCHYTHRECHQDTTIRRCYCWCV